MARSALTPEQKRFLEQNRFAVVGSRNPDGSPHLAVMWYLLDGDEILINSKEGRIKDRNLAADPRASVMVADGYRFVRIDGRVSIEHDQAIAQTTSAGSPSSTMGSARPTKPCTTTSACSTESATGFRSGASTPTGSSPCNGIVVRRNAPCWWSPRV